MYMCNTYSTSSSFINENSPSNIYKFYRDNPCITRSRSLAQRRQYLQGGDSHRGWAGAEVRARRKSATEQEKEDRESPHRVPPRWAKRETKMTKEMRETNSPPERRNGSHHLPDSNGAFHEIYLRVRDRSSRGKERRREEKEIPSRGDGRYRYKK